MNKYGSAIALKILSLQITNNVVDNIFSLFRFPDHLEKFTNYLNSKHKGIKLTYKKKDNSLPFLRCFDIKIRKWF